MSETRLYHKGHDLFTYERFETSKLAADDMVLRRFAYLLGAVERAVLPISGAHLDEGKSGPPYLAQYKFGPISSSFMTAW